MVGRLHGGRKSYAKIGFAVNVEAVEVVAMEATTDDVHYSKAFQGSRTRPKAIVSFKGIWRWSMRLIGDIWAFGGKGMEAAMRPGGNGRIDADSGPG